ncbi:hypothetical protein CYMTET_46158 [Cymbomonas tetramitiformis]|uniref:Uncharacterized protein n=1 Tax=Cymbomonas tetramitiformis TaxID=36881 RepID=A0AAE0EXV5_9CHLO|nr:hypothetical protein CYMTET_46158 [Cymbomonas tetramitiformis]
MRFRSAPASLFCVVAICLVHIAAGFRMSSGYNSAKVEAVVYTGSSTTLTWTLHHDLCNNAGVQTPGTSNTNYQNQYCSYSSSDNFIVTSGCNWGTQSFSYVDGSLNGGYGYIAGAQTPGTSNTNYQNQYCSYSSSDNFIVTSGCNWGSQSFSYVSGGLGGGYYGYIVFSQGVLD